MFEQRTEQRNNTQKRACVYTSQFHAEEKTISQFHVGFTRCIPVPKLLCKGIMHIYIEMAQFVTLQTSQERQSLQVMKDETWVTVEPMPNAFVVNLGIQLEAVSNGRFKSAFHRALASGSKTRISIPTFYGPSNDVFLSPAASMVDEEHPAMYRGYKVAEFMEMFYTQEKSSRSALDYFKI
eukprot:PITA_02587